MPPFQALLRKPWGSLLALLLFTPAARADEAEPAAADDGWALTEQLGRQLTFAQFNGWSLTQPPGSNLLSFGQELENVVDVRAGAVYNYLRLHATSNLGTNYSRVRVKLVLPSAGQDSDCLPGSEHEVPDMVHSLAPPTPLDGLTPARDPAYNYQNDWKDARFPYSGIFEACYFSGSSWYHVPGIFTVKGADSNIQKFWCAASTDVECRSLISGLGIKTTWLLTVVDWHETCGDVGSFSGAFNKSFSVATQNPLDSGQIFHTLGVKGNTDYATYKVCYCPGFTEYRLRPDNDPCTAPEDFVQLSGLLYATRVIPLHIVYPVIRFDLVVHCGAEAVGGCEATNEMRFKIVDVAQANDRPFYDEESGCRTAPQILSYFLPPNCMGPSNCKFQPTVPSDATPRWSGVRLRTTIENHAQKLLPMDVCLCLGECSLPESWFKVDTISTSAIKVLPDPFVAGSLMDLKLYGPQGGWQLDGHTHSRELKLLFDPEGSVGEEDCFLDPQDVRAITGHYCLTTTDCKAPTVSSDDGHVWSNVKVHFAGMYAVCYCDVDCNSQAHWSFLKWHLVAGPYSNHVWHLSREIHFDLTIIGWGLTADNRLRIIDEARSCGETAALPAAGVELPPGPPTQLAHLAANSVLSFSYTYDGIRVELQDPHDLTMGDHVTFADVTSLECQHCADLVTARPHKVIRIPVANEFIIPISYPERAFPEFQVTDASWVRSSEVKFRNLRGYTPASYKVCWSSSFTTSNAEDFTATVGSLTIFEPPLFNARVHLTTRRSGATAPVVIAFETRNDQKYAEALGMMQLQVLFRDLAKLEPGFSFPSSAQVLSAADARQYVCGQIIKELWSSDPRGFPMPKGCFYDESLAEKDYKEYSILFSERNGLRATTHYQVVMDARASLSLGMPQPRHGIVQLWSLDDIELNSFGVIEFGPAWLDHEVVDGAYGSDPQFNAVNGLKILASVSDVELGYASSWEVQIALRAAAGANIVQESVLRVFLWPLTQWNLTDVCVIACIPHMQSIGGTLSPTVCESPTCRPEALVDAVETVPGGFQKNVMRISFSTMDPITSSVKHTIVLSNLRLPTGGFFSTRLAAELQEEDGGKPSYILSVGALLYAKPSAVGSVLSGTGDGEDFPFRADQGNTLYARVVLGATIWGVDGDDAGFELRLPPGYICVDVDQAEADLAALESVAPQGRGEIGLDDVSDGYWRFSGQACIYILRKHGVVYAGSAIFAKLLVNNPVFALQRTDSDNVWSLQQFGRVYPGIATAAEEKYGIMSTFVDLNPSFRRNVPVLGRLSDATLSPMLFGAGQGQNWLSVFFTTERGSPGTGPKIELRVPNGFGFLPRCRVEPLPSYHYGTLSSRRAGVTLPTYEPLVVLCQSSKTAGSTLYDVATMTLSRYTKLKATTTYGFRILAFNAQSFEPAQLDGFRLTTRSADHDSLDATYYTVRFLASDGEGPGTSFGIYRLPMKVGTFATSLGNMLPYSETGIPSEIVVFPLRVPFDSSSAVDWRIVAPHGYEWDFLQDQFKYSTLDIMGTDADLPIAKKPVPPTLPPKNILSFDQNFQGSWNQMKVYGLIARIRVPDATPRSSVNNFFVEFGYTASTAEERLAGTSYEAPLVRALINTLIDYQLTNLAGQQNRLLVQVETITNLQVGGGFVLEAPQGFVFEESCVLLNNPMRELPFVDLAPEAPMICSSEVPFTTNKPVVTIAIVKGEVRAAKYEFMIDAENPRWTYDAMSMSWSISTYANIGLLESADLSSTLEGFSIEDPMLTGELVSDVSYARTHRDDHPEQRSFVVLAFQLKDHPSSNTEQIMTVKAPLGFKFASLCQIVIGDDVFGTGEPFNDGCTRFEASATVGLCEGSRNTARITVKPGLLNLRKYAFRLEVFNPSSTPEYNKWTISFSGESAVPFPGYRLWKFTEVAVSASHAARSTAEEETRNTVSLLFRPANTAGSPGFLAITGPFGFQIATACSVRLERLSSLGEPVEELSGLSCRGSPQPTNAAEVHISTTTGDILALEPYRLHIEVTNPLSIPVDPGLWHLQSYRSVEAGYENLLDIGEATSFPLTEVFHTLEVTYPPYVNPLDLVLELTVRVILRHAVELGDAIVIHGPEGYDFAVAVATGQHALEHRACRSFEARSPHSLPTPVCLGREIRFIFQSGGIPLDTTQMLTPLMEFKVQTAYPRRTLDSAKNQFHGDHMRGEVVLSSKTVQGQTVTPRLQGLSVQRMDAKIAVGSPSALTLSFFPSQAADALLISTGGAQSGEQDTNLQFSFSLAQVSAFQSSQPMEFVSILHQSNESMLVGMDLQEGLSYSVELTHVHNPVRPGKALWYLTTYTQPPDSEGISWLEESNQRDRSGDVVGPPTFSRIALDTQSTTLGSPFFDADATELQLAFHVYPMAVSPGQFIILYAPFGYTLLDRTFKPGDGFPLVSGSVYVRAAADTPLGLSAYVIQILTRISPYQVIKFGVRVNTPRTPDDIAVWETDHTSSWLLLAALDAEGLDPTASNDNLFPGFPLKASFGSVDILPEANGVTPRKHVTVTIAISPKTTLQTLIEGGSVHVRVTAPLGFDFDLGCLAVTPNPTFDSCTGFGRIAVLEVLGGSLRSGSSSAILGITNAGITPAVNTWLLESFVDSTIDGAAAASSGVRQLSMAQGYEVRELMQATVGANTQRSEVTTVFIWFLATNFLDVGGSMELHAPPSFELRCTPQILYISLPAGSCKLNKGTTSSSGDIFHHYLTLGLTQSDQLVYPNTAYEFGVSAVNPMKQPSRNYWGLVLFNPRKEVVDSSMTLEGYDLTDYRLLVYPPLASTTLPTVVNYVRLMMTFQQEVNAGVVGHITIRAPPTTKVLCQQFKDLSGGGSTLATLSLDPTYGTYGTHSCQFQNTVTLHLRLDRSISAGSYMMRVVVLNPGLRSSRDYWAVALHGPDSSSDASSSSAQSSAATTNSSGTGGNSSGNATGSYVAGSGVNMSYATSGDGGTNWRTSKAALEIQVSGFGISTAFSGQTLTAVPISSSGRPDCMRAGLALALCFSVQLQRIRSFR